MRVKMKTVNEEPRDITERKAKEKDYQGIIQTTTDGFWIVDTKGRFVDVNDAYCALIGYSREELLNMSIPDIEAVEIPEETARRIQRIIKNGHERFETRHRCKDGRIVDIEISTTYAGAGDGRFFVFARDITERKQAEETLERQRAYFQQLFDNSPDAIAWLDIDDRFVNVNKGFETLFGYRAEEIKGRFINDTIIPEDRMKEASVLSRARLSNKMVRKETVRKRKDGSLVDISIIGYSIRFGNEAVGAYAIYTDITERKQAEEALQQSREKLQQMFESVTDGIVVTDLNGVITETNQRTVEVHGFSSKDELLGRNAFELVAPRDHERVETNIRETLKRGVIKSEEYTLLKADGSEFPGELSTSVLKDASGNVVAHITIVRDNTRRKQTQGALLESEEKYRSLVKNVGLGIFRSTPGATGRFLEANPAMEEITGYSREELLRMNVSDLYVYPEEKSMLEEMALAKRKVRRELRLRKKDGTEVIVSDTRVAVRDSSGEVQYFDGILRDITERKRMEEALREREEFSSSLLSSSPNPILVLNSDTSIRYVNPALENLTGFASAELIGKKPPYPWWIEEMSLKTSKDLKEAMRRGRKQFEEPFQKRNGERFWVEITSVPQASHREFRYFLSNWVDITERKLAEEKEKQLQQELYLSRRLASIGELAAGVAHEINNPLTGVMGFSQRLLRKSASEEASRDLEIIYSEAQRAAKIVQNLLTFARRRKPKKEYSNINDIVQKTLELRGYELQTSNIELITVLAPRLPKIMVDFPQIQEVFLNVILNAEQAMSEAHGGGKLTIKTREVKDYVRISFADDGPGIPPEQLDKVFDPFFTTREEKGGTGLGLSACHGIVTEHGGRIYARSKPEKGATFFVELPLSPI